jgi:ligand-binding sensor domain-containing protein
MGLRRIILLCVAIGAILISAACGARPTVQVSPSPIPVHLHPTREPSTTISSSAVTPDGSLWYGFDQFDGVGGAYPGGQNHGLYRIKDGEVSHFDVPATIRVLEVAPDGSLYVGAGCGVLRYRMEKWETLANVDCDNSSFDGPVFPFDIAFAPNGDVWVGGIHGLARFDGRTWSEYDIKARRILVAPDGSVWTDGWDGRADSDCCFTHLTGGTWVTYTHSAALPVSDDLLERIQELRR